MIEYRNESLTDDENPDELLTLNPELEEKVVQAERKQLEEYAEKMEK